MLLKSTRQSIRIRKFCIAFVFGAILASPAAHSANLLDVLDLALSYDANLKSAKLQAASGELTPEITRSSIYPTISARTGYTRQYLERPDDRNTGSVSLSVQQPLWSPVLDAGLESAINQAELDQLRFVSAEQALLLKVVERYFGVLSAEDNLRTAQSEVTAIEKHLHLATERLKVGLGTRTELFDAQARHSLALASMIQAESAIQSAKYSLGEITGVDNLELNGLSEDTVAQNPNPEDIDWWKDTARENNLEVDQQRKNVRIAELNVALEDARGSPSVDLSASVETFMAGSKSGGSDSRVSVTLNIPLYQGNVVNKRVKQATLNHRAQQEALNALEYRVSSDVSTAYLNVIRDVSQVQALQSAVRASESALYAKEEGFNVGIQTTTDVLDAQRDLFAATRDFQRARYDYFVSVIRLESVAGMLDRSDLEKLNELLE